MRKANKNKQLIALITSACAKMIAEGQGSQQAFQKSPYSLLSEAALVKGGAFMMRELASSAP